MGRENGPSKGDMGLPKSDIQAAQPEQRQKYEADAETVKFGREMAERLRTTTERADELMKKIEITVKEHPGQLGGDDLHNKRQLDEAIGEVKALISVMDKVPIGAGLASELVKGLPQPGAEGGVVMQLDGQSLNMAQRYDQINLAFKMQLRGGEK